MKGMVGSALGSDDGVTGSLGVAISLALVFKSDLPYDILALTQTRKDDLLPIPRGQALTCASL